MIGEQKWPDTIWLVRHGESAANVARAAADASGDPHIGLAIRDVDVALSDRGARQAQALGKWFGNLPADEQPTVILVSPYARAVQMATLLRYAAGLDRPEVSFALDERLREKEFGVLDGLTKAGIHYLFARLSEEEILTLDRDSEVANCSVTEYQFDPRQGRQGKLALRNFNLVTPLEQEGTAVTSAPDKKVVP